MIVRRPDSLSEALESASTNAECVFMAGGTDLLVTVRDLSSRSGCLILLDRIPELQSVTVDDRMLWIGAAIPLRRLAGHPAVLAGAPLVADAIAALGTPQVRNMATLGGNICTASPAADTLPPLYVYDAAVRLCSLRGTREMPLAHFLLGPGRKALARDEVLAAVGLPLRENPPGRLFYKVGRRGCRSVSVCCFAAHFHKLGAYQACNISMAWGAVAPIPVRMTDVETELNCSALTEGLLNRLSAIVSERVSPIDDLRASAEYRRQVAGNCLFRLRAEVGP